MALTDGSGAGLVALTLGDPLQMNATRCAPAPVSSGRPRSAMSQGSVLWLGGRYPQMTALLLQSATRPCRAAPWASCPFKCKTGL